MTATMRTDVLDVANFPEIRLTSRSVEPSNDHLRIVASLTIKGVTRELPLDVQLTITSDTLRATATFAVKQTDFGIRPYRGGPGGTVRVADKVTFDISAVAVRQ